MTFVDLFRRQLDRDREPLDVLSLGAPDLAERQATYRLGFRAGFLDGFPDRVNVGNVAISYTAGPVLTQRTEIRQRPGTELIFDKSMRRGVEVGRGHWVTVCEIEDRSPPDSSSRM